MSNELELSAIPMELDFLPSILDLNDDCLLKILSNLDTMDLCAVNDTCQRFRQLSDNHFRIQYSFKPFLFQKRDTSKPRTVKRTLKHFGKHINKLIIHSNKTNKNLQRVLQLIGIYSGQYLKEVELNRVLLDSISVPTWETLLGHVERLSLCYCRGETINMYQCLNSCNALKELEVIKQPDFCFFNFDFRKRQPKLQSFTLKNSRDKCNTLFFIQRKFDLKKLRVIDNYYSMEWVINDILRYSRSIEEIAIQILTFSENLLRLLPRLSELEKLKRLEFNCGGKTFTPLINLLAERNIMEHLSISCTELNRDLCEALGKMKSLKTLKLISMTKEYYRSTKILSTQSLQLERFYVVGSNAFTLSNAIEMIEGVPNLRWLIVKDCNQFTTIGCNEFLRIAQARKRKYYHQLITIYLDESVLNATIEKIPQQMREQNSGYIKLMSTLRPEIQNEDFIVDFAEKIWFGGTLRYIRDVPIFHIFNGRPPDFDFLVREIMLRSLRNSALRALPAVNVS